MSWFLTLLILKTKNSCTMPILKSTFPNFVNMKNMNGLLELIYLNYGECIFEQVVKTSSAT